MTLPFQLPTAVTNALPGVTAVGSIMAYIKALIANVTKWALYIGVGVGVCLVALIIHEMTKKPALASDASYCGLVARRLDTIETTTGKILQAVSAPAAAPLLTAPEAAPVHKKRPVSKTSAPHANSG